MYICKSCGAVFEAPKNEYYDKGTGVWEHQGCPECDSTGFTEAEQCSICGKWFDEDELHGGVCEKCMEEHGTIRNATEYGSELTQTTLIELNGFLAYCYSVREIEDLLLEDLMKCDRRKAYAKTFCADDPDAFAQWVKAKEAQA